MAFINIGNIEKDQISIVVGCVFCLLNRILNYYSGSLILENPIFMDIIIFFSYLFTIIPLIIYKIRSESKTSFSIENTIENKYSLLYQEDKFENINGKKRLIFLSSVLFFTQSIIFVITIKLKTNVWIVEILFSSLFYFLIFKKKLYKHHYLSIVLIIIIGMIIDLYLGNLQDNISDNILLFLLRFLRELLTSLNDVLDKYIIEKKFGSIYEIIFSFGFINIILVSIFEVLDYYFFSFDNLKKYFTNFNGTELLVIFGVMITQLGLCITILMTNKNYTPCHIFIIIIFGQFGQYINFSGISIIVIICLIFILFFALIFNEIIEINVLGLSDNTKKNIRNRADIETKENIFIPKTDTIDSDSEKNEEIIELESNLVNH